VEGGGGRARKGEILLAVLPAGGRAIPNPLRVKEGRSARRELEGSGSESRSSESESR
jgi:hypothetical protein